MSDEKLHDLFRGATSPFLQAMEFEPSPPGDGTAEMSFTAKEIHLRTKGIVHGGVLASLLDTVMGMAALTRMREQQDLVTAQLNINYIRPGWDGERLTAKAEVQHAGRQTAVVRGEIRNDQGLLVATGSGTFLYIMLPSKAPPQ